MGVCQKKHPKALTCKGNISGKIEHGSDVDSIAYVHAMTIHVAQIGCTCMDEIHVSLSCRTVP
jgi:hypothetical protein